MPSVCWSKPPHRKKADVHDADLGTRAAEHAIPARLILLGRSSASAPSLHGRDAGIPTFSI